MSDDTIILVGAGVALLLLLKRQGDAKPAPFFSAANATPGTAAAAANAWQATHPNDSKGTAIAKTIELVGISW